MSLRCEEVRDRFSALWENDLGPSEQAAVKSHLDHCSECQNEFARFDKTLRMLHSVDDVKVPERFLPGIYEKMEERRGKDLSSARTSWRWPHVPLRLKLPIQALAMVAIVFLALYLTKMTPIELTRMKEVGESKPSPLEGKKEPGETKAQTPEEKRLDQVSPYKEADKMGKREGSRGLKERARTTPEVSPTGASKEKEGLAPKTPTTETRKSDQGLAHPSAPSPVPHPQGALTPQADEPLKMKKAEDASLGKETISPEMKPSQEYVLKITDRKRIISRLQNLTKQFGGETLTAEGNRLLISVPTSSVAEFRKELEGISSFAKAQQRETFKDTPERTVAEPREKKRAAEEKDKETKRLEVSREGRTLIRIVLVEE
jgi:hypothetical protein